MKDLFVLNDDGENGSTETSNIFSQLSEDVNIIGAQQDKQENSKAAVSCAGHAVSGKGNFSNTGLSKKKGKENDHDSDGEVDEETNILRSLFDAQGIHVRYASTYNDFLHLMVVSLFCLDTSSSNDILP